MNATPPATPDLTAENAALKTRIKEMETGGDSVEVKTKMAAGLTREQAHSAIKHQAAFTKAFDSRITSKTKAQS